MPDPTIAYEARIERYTDGAGNYDPPLPGGVVRLMWPCAGVPSRGRPCTNRLPEPDMICEQCLYGQALYEEYMDLLEAVRKEERRRYDD